MQDVTMVILCGGVMFLPSSLLAQHISSGTRVPEFVNQDNPALYWNKLLEGITLSPSQQIALNVVRDTFNVRLKNAVMQGTLKGPKADSLLGDEVRLRVQAMRAVLDSAQSVQFDANNRAMRNPDQPGAKVEIRMERKEERNKNRGE